MIARIRSAMSGHSPADLASDAVAMAVMIGALPFVPHALALLKVLAEAQP